MRIPLAFLIFSIPQPLSAENQKWPIRESLPIYDAVVSNTRIRIVVSEQPFDPTRHRITQRTNIGSEDKPEWIEPTIDYKSFVGSTIETEGNIPPPGSPQLAKITVYFGDKLVEVPPQLLNNVFFARLRQPGVFSIAYADSIVSVSADARCVQISIGVGEGGGQSTVFFAVAKDGGSTEGTPSRDLPGR